MSGASKQAVAGVVPFESEEALITQVCPSIAANPVGRVLGRLYDLPIPFGLIFAMLTLPIPLVLFFATLFRRYALSTRRVWIRKGLRGKDGPGVQLAEIEEVRVAVRPGQEFYRAADLHVVVAGRDALLLRGVPNPEAFRHNILAARDAVVQVRAVREASSR